MTTPSKPLQTTHTLIHAFNTMDIPTIISLRTPSCLRTILPTTLHIPPQSNNTYRTNLLAMKSIFSTFTLTVSDIIEGVSRDENGAERTKIVVFVRARGDTSVGLYENEYVWKLGFDESGERVDEWVEYVDVGMARDFFPKLKAEI